MKMRVQEEKVSSEMARRGMILSRSGPWRCIAEKSLPPVAVWERRRGKADGKPAEGADCTRKFAGLRKFIASTLNQKRVLYVGCRPCRFLFLLERSKGKGTETALGGISTSFRSRIHEHHFSSWPLIGNKAGPWSRRGKEFLQRGK